MNFKEEKHGRQKQDTALIRDCKVECRKNHYSAVGTFQIQLSPTFDIHELDQIEAEIEQAGQEFQVFISWLSK